MNLFRKTRQKIFKRPIDLIEWIVHTSKTVIWHFSPYNAYFEYGARLKVRKEQVAVLINEGKFADVYQPGEYELTTNNMPILTTMKGWKRDFDSPFKMDVYFVCTKHFLDVPWTTQESILMHDKEFGQIHISAHGTYSFRVEHNPIVFIRNVVGRESHFTTDSITEQLRKFVEAKFCDYLIKSNITALDLTKDLEDFSKDFTVAMKNDFSEFGIELSQLVVENISLPKAVKVALYKQKRKRAIKNMTSYSQMKFDDSFKS